MTWLEQLRGLRTRARMTGAQISEKSGIATATLDKIFSGNTKNPGINTVAAMVHAMGYTLSDIDPEERAGRAKLSEAAMQLAADYDGMDRWGQRQLRTVADNELTRSRWKQESEVKLAESGKTETKIIPLIGARFAAGLGEPDFGNALEDYEVPAETRADFAVRVNGDSMEPYLHDGSVALGSKGNPRNGDVVAIMVDGCFYIKQFCMDSFGNLYLFSLNRRRKNLDVTVMESAGSMVSCFGTILMPTRLPLPVDTA